MMCFVYRSRVRADTYLYLPKKESFDAVPEALLKQFGQPEFALVIQLDKRDKLAQVDIEKVRQAMIDPGYFLQLPPPQPSLLPQSEPGK